MATVLVLYKIVNCDEDKGDPLFNAFHIPRGSGTTLKAVKESCEALRHLNPMGVDGFHWRVCVEDKPVPGATGEKTFSWWDVQDENARLPVKEATSSKLNRFFAPHEDTISTTDAAAKAAKGAFKSFGKAMNAVAGTEGTESHGPPVAVIAFKLLDLMKMHDDFGKKHGGHPPSTPAPRAQPRARAPAPAPRHQQQHPARAAPAPRQQQQQQQQRRQQPAAARQQQPPPQQQQQAASLMDFGAPASAPAQRHQLHHATSSPASFNGKPPPPSNETRTEKLKREYKQKSQTANRVWDDVDQRWVEIDPKAINASRGTASAPPGDNVAKKKEVGISLDPASAVGKSQGVQTAVNKRVNDMRQSQAKALKEMREREEKKKKDEDEEDVARKRLEPKIKAWSEEHGKKKQLRALIGTLHTILWPGANWKPMGLGDLLDDSKVKRAFHKASRVVHPDKTHHLEPEQRFLAKRIFDSLSQAKTIFDDGP